MSATLELRVDGQSGVLDAAQSLRVLAMLAELVATVAPEDAELPLRDLRISSAVAFVDPTNVTTSELSQRVREAFERPSQLTRRLRADLADAFKTRRQFGIDGFGYRADGRSTPFDELVYRRVRRSLDRPTGWASVNGEVRRLGKTQVGVSGTIRSSVDGHVVNFEAPAELEEPLRDALFRRAVLSGSTEVDDAGTVKRVMVERVEQLGEFSRLSEADYSDVEIAPAAALERLQELRRA